MREPELLQGCLKPRAHCIQSGVISPGCEARSMENQQMLGKCFWQLLAYKECANFLASTTCRACLTTSDQ